MTRHEVDVLSKEPNATVLSVPWRRFPGLLVQGDSLATIYDDLDEAQGLLARSNRDPAVLSELDATISGLRDRVGTLLRAYEAALAESGIELPYSKSSSARR